MSLNKLISIILLTGLILPGLFSLVSFNYNKYQIKKQVKKEIIKGFDKSELSLISISKHQKNTKLQWIHSKEFRYNGEMYDIVKLIETPDSIHYYCWWDKEETELNNKISNVLNHIFSDNPQSKKMLSKSFSFLGVFYEIVKVFDSLINESYLLMYFHSSESTISQSCKPITPPPQLS